MSQASKPLIFVYPLSETLEKLKEVIEDIKEDEGIDVYDLDDLSEVNQLVPSIGQSLIICGNPKKCAMLMQANRRPLAKLNSKVLLLNQKNIPHRTLDKLSKIGLTEYIKEPVNPKTLLYKVKLLLRSIKTQSDEDHELRHKSLAGHEKDFEDDEEEHDRNFEGGDEEDDEESFYKGQVRKKSDLEADFQEDSPRKSNYQEEAVSGHMRGSLGSKDDLEEDSDGTLASAGEAEKLSKHYKGSMSANADLEEEDDEPSKAALLEEDDEDINALREKLNSEVEEEINNEHNKSILALEEEEKEKKRNQPIREEHDKFMRGSLGEDEKEEKEREHTSNALDLEEDEDEGKDHLETPKIAEDEKTPKEMKPRLDLEDDEDEKDHLKMEKEEEEEKERKKKLLLDEEDDEDRERQAIDNNINDRMGGEGDHSADRLDTHYKGHTSHQDENKGDGNQRGSLENKPEEEKEKRERDHLALKEEEEENNKQLKPKLDLEDDEEDKDPLMKSVEDEKEPRAKKNKLDLEDEQIANKESLGKQEEDNDSPFQNKEKLNLEDDEKERDPLGQKEEEQKKKKPNVYDNFEPEKKQLKKKADARADQIKGHYSSKSSLKHNDQGWGNYKQDKQDEDFGDFPKKEDEFPESFGDFPKKQDEAQAEFPEEEKKIDGPQIFYESEELGEQTIDYRKLKDEFDGISWDGKKKKAQMSIEGGGPGEEVSGPQYIGEDINAPEQDIFEEDQENSDEAAAEGEIFEPTPNGLDTAIQVLSLYFNKITKDEEVFHFIANRIKNEEAGETSFFMYNKENKEFIESFNSYNKLSSNPDEDYSNWNSFKEENISEWIEMTLPTWSDITFQEENIVFFYPFFEGINNMGFAIVQFNSGIKEEQTKKIEIMLESARGLYLTNHHDSAHKSLSNDSAGSSSAKPESKKKEEKTGFFGRLFGKKTG